MNAAVLEPPVGAARASAALNLVDPEHPWLGLDSFSEETRQYFYGREEEVAELARRVQGKLLTILFGQSGLGKTSILRAGIVPRLRRDGYCPVYVRLDYARESPAPSVQIKQAIFRETEALGEWTKAGSAVEGESLWEFLHHRDDFLEAADGARLTPLLIFDQFEEIFTLAQDDDFGRRRAAEFIEDLADLVENRAPAALEQMLDSDDSVGERFDFSRADYRILISLREDYLANLEAFRSSMPAVTQNRMRLARMTGQQALAAVMKPGGRLVTQEVAESIVRFVAGGAELRNADVEPSLLSLICRELNNARVAQSRDEISADLIAGSRETILQEFYERAIADQPPGVRRFVEDEMLTESGFRESLAEERVQRAFAAAGAPHGALATLVNRRLLRIEERLDLRRVELTHDVLCKVVVESRDARHEREAREDMERQLAAERASKEAARKALMRARQVAVGCGVLAVVAAGSAVFGYHNLSRARAAEAEAQQVRAMAERARGEAEKLLGFLVDDFYLELAPVGRLGIIENLAQRAIAYYRELPPQLRTNESETNRALALAQLGQVFNASNKLPQAEAALKEALDILRGLRAKGDQSPPNAYAMARASSVSGFIAFTRNRFDDAISQYNEGLDLLRPHARGASAPEAYRRQEAQLLNQLGLALLRDGRDGSLPILEESVRGYKGLRVGEDERHLLSGQFGFASAWLTEALYREGRLEDATTTAVEAVAVLDKALAARPNDRGALRARATLKSQLSTHSNENLRIAAALEYAIGAERDDEAAYRSDPSNMGVVNNYVLRHADVAYNFHHLGRFQEGIRHLRKIRVWDDMQLYPFLSRNLANLNSGLAEAEANSGEFDRAASALAAARKFLAAGVAVGGSNEINKLVESRLSVALSRIESANGDASAARKHAEAALELLGGLPTPKGRIAADIRSLNESQALHALAQAAARQGDHATAETAARRAVELLQGMQRLGLRREAEIQGALVAQGKAMARQGRLAEARSVLGPAVTFFRKPEVSRGDSITAKVQLAEALHAYALALPAAERRSLLREASGIMEALPTETRRWRPFNRVREEIAADQRSAS
jgi:tetratricopeptide (TPR) repeat protein